MSRLSKFIWNYMLANADGSLHPYQLSRQSRPRQPHTGFTDKAALKEIRLQDYLLTFHADRSSCRDFCHASLLETSELKTISSRTILSCRQAGRFNSGQVDDARCVQQLVNGFDLELYLLHYLGILLDIELLGLLYLPSAVDAHDIPSPTHRVVPLKFQKVVFTFRASVVFLSVNPLSLPVWLHTYTHGESLKGGDMTTFGAGLPPYDSVHHVVQRQLTVSTRALWTWWHVRLLSEQADGLTASLHTKALVDCLDALICKADLSFCWFAVALLAGQGDDLTCSGDAGASVSQGPAELPIDLFLSCLQKVFHRPYLRLPGSFLLLSLLSHSPLAGLVRII